MSQGERVVKFTTFYRIVTELGVLALPFQVKRNWTSSPENMKKKSYISCLGMAQELISEALKEVNQEELLEELGLKAMPTVRELALHMMRKVDEEGKAVYGDTCVEIDGVPPEQDTKDRIAELEAYIKNMESAARVNRRVRRELFEKMEELHKLQSKTYKEDLRAQLELAYRIGNHDRATYLEERLSDACDEVFELNRPVLDENRIRLAKPDFIPAELEDNDVIDRVAVNGYEVYDYYEEEEFNDNDIIAEINVELDEELLIAM